MWEHLNRQGIRVAKCTVERLMRAERPADLTLGQRTLTGHCPACTDPELA